MTPTPEDILQLYPRPGFERFALSAIRVALKTTPANLLFELTRRYAESWRGEALHEIPIAFEFYRKHLYLDESTWGPRRSYKPHDKPLYESIDAARNKGAPDTKLEAQELRRI